MKNEKKTNDLQAQPACFQIKFSPAIFWVCIGIYALCAAGIAVSVWQIANVGVHGFTEALQYPFLIAIGVFCIVLVTSILSNSRYVVDGKYLIAQYGFIKSKYPVETITSLLLDSDEKKLTVYFNEQYIVISVAAEWNEKFVRALLAANENIEYSFTLSERTTDDNEEEK